MNEISKGNESNLHEINIKIYIVTVDLLLRTRVFI